MSQEKPRPPYVVFERRAIEDRLQETEKGRYGFKDVDVALITVPGQKDTVERYVEDWLEDVRKRAQAQLIPYDWPEQYEKAYDFWKRGQEMPVNGTPVRGWALLSPAMQKNVLEAGVQTVEDLAALSDEAVRRIGPGAVTSKQKAEAWLKESNAAGSVAAVNATMQRDLEAQKALIEEQTRQIEELKKYLPKAPEATPAKASF